MALGFSPLLTERGGSQRKNDSKSLPLRFTSGTPFGKGRKVGIIPN